MQMGSKQMGLFVLFLVTCLQILAPSSPLHNPFVSGRHHINGYDGDRSERSSIAHSTKFAHGGGGRSTGGAANGGANGIGSNGATDNGNSNGQGGRAVIPVIIGGAASNRHPNNHRSAASTNRNTIRLSTMVMVNLATFIVQLNIYFGYRI